MIALLSALVIGALPQTVHVNVDGVDRTALIVVPPGGGKHPVIFGYHGHGGNARYAFRRFDLHDLWPDAIAVYPQGLPTSSHLDPAGRSNGWNIKPNEENPDLRFFDKLYAQVLQNYSADPNKVFAMGHSNGGAFMYTLWITRSSKLAGLGSFEGAGALTGRLSPMPFFITIGDNDQIVSPQLQHRSLDAAKAADASANNGVPYGPQGTLFKGKQPLVYWSYPGGHTFPADATPTMIQLFQSIASKR